MKAISLWQPWATAMAVGAKRFETRDWPATSGGQLLSGWMAICASKRTHYPKEEGGAPLSDDFEELLESDYFRNHLFNDSGFGRWESLPLGKVVAIGWLHKVHTAQEAMALPTFQEGEEIWGGYGPGRYAWEFSEMWRLMEPMPVRGMQKIFDIEMPANWRDQCIHIYQTKG